jgi:hypothetical protein
MMEKLATTTEAPPFPITTANLIAGEETQVVPNPPRTKTLEDVGLRTANARDLYVVRVVKRVANEPVPGGNRNYRINKKDIPSKAATKVGDVADAIVINAS